MKKPDPAMTNDGQEADSDLARRLARYRSRLESEGRQRSVKFIDRAIEDADRKADGEAAA